MKRKFKASRALLTYDFISTSTEHGVTNHNLILETFLLVLRKLPIVVNTTLDQFQATQFFKYSDKTLPNQIFYDVDVSTISEPSLAYLKNALKDYDILIGLELSQATRNLLDKLGICYLDIWLSPIRFYKDTMFEFHSNHEEINANLKRYSFDNSLLHDQVKKLSEHAEQFLNKMALAKNSCLVIGQMQQDKSVLCDGKFLSLLDYLSAIEDLSKQYTKLYLLKHPFEDSNTFGPIKRALIKIKNLEILENINTYHLLMQPEICCVTGISSSVLSEASYFDKKVQFFHQPIIPNGYIRVFRNYFTTTFWASLLGIESTINATYFAEDNFYRYKYGMSYSYDQFMPTSKPKLPSIESTYKSVVSIYKFIDNLEENQSFVLYGFGSVGKLLFPHIKDKLVAIADKNVSDNSKFHEGIVLIHPKALSDYPDANIIISSFLYNEQILTELRHLKNRITVIEI